MLPTDTVICNATNGNIERTQHNNELWNNVRDLGICIAYTHFDRVARVSISFACGQAVVAINLNSSVLYNIFSLKAIPFRWILIAGVVLLPPIAPSHRDWSGHGRAMERRNYQIKNAKVYPIVFIVLSAYVYVCSKRMNIPYSWATDVLYVVSPPPSPALNTKVVPKLIYDICRTMRDGL